MTKLYRLMGVSAVRNSPFVIIEDADRAKIEKVLDFHTNLGAKVFVYVLVTI